MDVDRYLFIAGGILLLLILITLWFVYLPVLLYTDAECLRKGFPRSHVTIGLERYCSTLDGAVTVKVQKMSSSEKTDVEKK